MLKPHFTLLDELAFSKLALFLTPASVLSALGNVKQATTPVDLVTLHFCIVLRKRSTGFGNHQFPSFPGSQRLVDSIFVEIKLFLSPGLHAFLYLPPKSHSSAIWHTCPHRLP